MKALGKAHWHGLQWDTDGMQGFVITRAYQRKSHLSSILRHHPRCMPHVVTSHYALPNHDLYLVYVTAKVHAGLILTRSVKPIMHVTVNGFATYL